jgi:hypothetical protein
LSIHLTRDLAGRARFGPEVEWVRRRPDLLARPSDGALQPAGVRPKMARPGGSSTDLPVQSEQNHRLPQLVNLSASSLRAFHGGTGRGIARKSA